MKLLLIVISLMMFAGVANAKSHKRPGQRCLFHDAHKTCKRWKSKGVKKQSRRNGTYRCKVYKRKCLVTNPCLGTTKLIKEKKVRGCRRVSRRRYDPRPRGPRVPRGPFPRP